MRQIDLLVLSDIHLGTFGCHAQELIDYLSAVNPKTIILNGDIIDGWQFKKKNFPALHCQVIDLLLDKLNTGSKIYYITGNHDDFLRKFSDFQLADFYLLDQLTFEMDGKKYWVFHGDIFDSSITIAPWIAKLGGFGYDMLIRINRLINNWLIRLNKSPMSFSKKIKNNVKKAVKFINDFEMTAITLAEQKNYDAVICGHIHQPKDEIVIHNQHTIRYLNSGDWVESLTALEYTNGKWEIYDHLKMKKSETIVKAELTLVSA